MLYIIYVISPLGWCYPNCYLEKNENKKGGIHLNSPVTRLLKNNTVRSVPNYGGLANGNFFAIATQPLGTLH